MSKDSKVVYAVLLADEKGEFKWIYNHPQTFYDTREEAEKIWKELIKNEDSINTKNSKVATLLKIENKKSN